MLEYFERYINIQRWNHAFDCVLALYSIPITPCTPETSATPEQKRNEPEK